MSKSLREARCGRRFGDQDGPSVSFGGQDDPSVIEARLPPVSVSFDVRQGDVRSVSSSAIEARRPPVSFDVHQGGVCPVSFFEGQREDLPASSGV